jgi:leucyl-tRNA synthetase
MKLEGFVSNSAWPEANESLISKIVEEKEEYLLEVIADINKVQKMVKSETINKIEIIISPKWKEAVFHRFLSSQNNLISEIMKNSEIKEKGKLAIQYANKLLKNKDEIPYSFDRRTEFDIIQSAKRYIETMTKSSIEIVFCEESLSPKRNQAEPFRPAIYIY